MAWRRHRRSRGWNNGYSRFPEYVPVAERRAKAETQMKKLAGKGGMAPQPVRLAGTKIAHTFWGKAWCANLESYSDYANRLPRGRSYVRNGSVLHLEIRKGEIAALVSGRSLYKIKIAILPVKPATWTKLCKQCAGGIGSLMELLEGKLSERVMNIMTAPGSGLFPAPAEIKLDCSCPDWAEMCKHVAATMYGVGARLDLQPELLFLLRHVDHNELVGQASAVTALTDGPGTANTPTLDADDVSTVFGIELAPEAPAKAANPLAKNPMSPPPSPPVKKLRAAKKPVTSKSAAQRKPRGKAKRNIKPSTGRV